MHDNPTEALRRVGLVTHERHLLRLRLHHNVVQATRLLGLAPEQAASPLARRPCDLRHAAVSLWLNAGVHAPEVAGRAAHTVDVLLKIYATCIDGRREVAGQRIEKALGES
ncbi:hypothetical protein ACIBQ1_41030 [Nonomuraea sp. NPDC050153]|uniref:hypothetical protein n=1 Tax=Nonomuraea sp. NPDC050153 TaxID=3364359 RepID=UPI0037BDD029